MTRKKKSASTRLARAKEFINKGKPMTFNIATPDGIVEISAPFRLSKRHQSKIRQVFAEITSPDEPLAGETMESFLKRTTPTATTPVGKIQGFLALYGWTQKTLSQKSGLSVSVICDILKGRRSIGVASAKKLAKALNVDYRKLL